MDFVAEDDHAMFLGEGKDPFRFLERVFFAKGVVRMAIDEKAAGRESFFHSLEIVGIGPVFPLHGDPENLPAVMGNRRKEAVIGGKADGNLVAWCGERADGGGQGRDDAR